jgi:excisionase family DNA binding protein
MHHNQSSLLTQTEAARFLRVSERTLERWRVEGQGPCFSKIGRRVVYRAEELDAWVNAQTRTSTSEVPA